MKKAHPTIPQHEMDALARCLFYDFAGYAKQRMSQEQGQFVKNGYISYQGALSLDELMADSQEQGFQMGGMQ